MARSKHRAAGILEILSGLVTRLDENLVVRYHADGSRCGGCGCTNARCW
jgi:hypothetical protein